MAYATLQAKTGWLYGEPSLEPGLVTKAEDWATAEIDRLFWSWDRTAWSAAPPFEIAEIAELLAAGHYMELAQAKGQVEDLPEKGLAKALIERGYRRAELIRNQGGPMNAARDEREEPNDTRGFSRFCEIEPT